MENFLTNVATVGFKTNRLVRTELWLQLISDFLSISVLSCLFYFLWPTSYNLNYSRFGEKENKSFNDLVWPLGCSLVAWSSYPHYSFIAWRVGSLSFWTRLLKGTVGCAGLRSEKLLYMVRTWKEQRNSSQKLERVRKEKEEAMVVVCVCVGDSWGWGG